MAFIICENCGKTIKTNMDKCLHCGAKVNKTEDVKQKKDYSIYIALVIVVLLNILSMMYPRSGIFYVTIFFAIIFGFIALGKLADNENKKILDRDKKIRQKLKMNNFSTSQMTMDKDNVFALVKEVNKNEYGLAVDEKAKKICLIKYNNAGENIDICVLSYKDVLSSEIFVNGTTITKTARGSQIGGALIGGLFLGGIGAVVGGLSGNKTSSEEVNKIDLQITVNRKSNPIHDINFMNEKCNKNDRQYNSAMAQARHWHGLIAILIKDADLEDDAKEKDRKPTKDNSIADELSKLAKLYEQGLLTEEEFKAQKIKLLENS